MDTPIFSRPEVIWFIVGLGLFLLELVLPGFVIFFFGVGAWITALLCLIANPGINLQVIVFAVTSVLSLLALRKMIQKRFFYPKQEHSDDVEDEFTGREGVAVSSFGYRHLMSCRTRAHRWHFQRSTSKSFRLQSGTSSTS